MYKQDSQATPSSRANRSMYGSFYAAGLKAGMAVPRLQATGMKAASSEGFSGGLWGSGMMSWGLGFN